MRGLVLFLILIGCPSLYSQDLLTTKDGKVMKVKIQKIDESTIQYYRYDDSSKILFTEEKARFTKIELVDFNPLSNLAMEPVQINIDPNKNGYFTVNGEQVYSFNKLGPFLKSNDLAFSHFQKYQSRQKKALGLLVVTGVLLAGGSSLLYLGANNEDGIALNILCLVFGGLATFIVAPVAAIGSLLTYSLSKRAKKNTIRSYGITSLNEKQNKSIEHTILKLGIVNSGVGLQINF